MPEAAAAAVAAAAEVGPVEVEAVAWGEAVAALACLAEIEAASAPDEVAEAASDGLRASRSDAFAVSAHEPSIPCRFIRKLT